MRTLLSLLAAALLTAAYVSAQDKPLGNGQAVGDAQSVTGGSGKAALAAKAPRPYAAGGARSSPFPTPTPTDTHFVVDEDAGLDTDCRFRSDGSLKFTVKVTRYVGAVGGDGTLSNPQALVSNGVVSATAQITMPAFDVDFNAPVAAPYFPERDRILFNGHPVGDLSVGAYLNGENQRWRINRITVPIQYVRFAQRGPHGGEPTPGLNEIEILVDQANVITGENLWCTAIDWAAIKFDALAPVIMVHGNGETGAFWDEKGFTQPFQQAGVPYDNSITTPKDFIAENAKKLAAEIPRVAREFGVKHIHIVAHSKGGLDTREFLKTLPAEGQLAVLSLTTLSTPHHGSVLADYIRDARGAGARHSDSYARTRFFQSRLAGAFDRGRQNLTTRYLRAFNRRNLPLPQAFFVDGEESGVNYLSYGADTNLDDSFNSKGRPTISWTELSGTGYGFPGAGYGGQLIYRTLYYVARTKSGTDAQGRKVVRETPNARAEPNDILVTITSSKLPNHFLARPDLKRNHATVADAGVGQLVLGVLRSLQPMTQ
jgi:pimeloyl-ACP methyl ester carboxylesterase